MKQLIDEDGIKRGMFRALMRRFFLRFHITVILLWTFSCGFAISKLLLAFGMQSMLARYAAVLVFAYLMFLLAVRLWLQYVGYGRYLRGRDNGTGDVPLDAPFGGGGSSKGDPIADIQPGGGSFGGAGSSASYDSSGNLLDGASDVTTEGVGSAAVEGGLPGLAIVLVVFLGFLVIAATAYFVAMAPAVLVDAAFEAALAGGLIHGARRMDSATWIGAVVRATCIPFLIIMILTVTVAAIIQSYYPLAVTMSDAVDIFRQQ